MPSVAVVPDARRRSFLKRLLDYYIIDMPYSRVNYDGLIGDSSRRANLS